VKSAGPIYACVLSSLVLKQAVSLRSVLCVAAWPLGSVPQLGSLALLLRQTCNALGRANHTRGERGPLQSERWSCVEVSRCRPLSTPRLRVWASLLPILGGVALATTSELTLAWAALFGAVISDVALALRNIYCKVSPHRCRCTRGRAATLHTRGAATLHTRGAAILHTLGAAILHTLGAAILHTLGAAILHTLGAAILHTLGAAILHTRGAAILHTLEAAILHTLEAAILHTLGAAILHTLEAAILHTLEAAILHTLEAAILHTLEAAIPCARGCDPTHHQVSMEKREGSNLSAANTFALTTCLSVSNGPLHGATPLQPDPLGRVHWVLGGSEHSQGEPESSSRADRHEGAAVPPLPHANA
jgi:hypothetical protein